VFTNLYVALCGAALTAASPMLLSEPLRLDSVTGLVFCCTLFVYNLDRLVEPSPGDSDHEQWIETHRGLLWGLAILSGIGAIAFTTQLNRASLISLPIAGLFAVGYCLPIVRFAGKWHRLKAVPGAKLLLIAAVWTYATLGLPMLEHRATLDTQNVAALVARFLFIAAVALPFDLPDMQRDRLSGIATIPILLGVRFTRRIAFVMIAASALVSLVQPWPANLALIGSCAAVATLLAMLRSDRGVLYFMVALDGTLLVQAGLLVILAD
jgi:4-hydroxybenzoate polyprenyltransferase